MFTAIVTYRTPACLFVADYVLIIMLGIRLLIMDIIVRKFCPWYNFMTFASEHRAG